jgi:hypothetical protein
MVNKLGQAGACTSPWGEAQPRKICDMHGVRSYDNGDDPVELWLHDSGRLVIVASNEAGYCGTNVDLYDLLDWLQSGPGCRMVLDNGQSSHRNISTPARD